MFYTKKYFKNIISTPPHLLFQRAALKYNRFVQQKKVRERDLHFATRVQTDLLPAQPLLLKTAELDTSLLDKNVCLYLASMYSKHKFDLLGSGWVKNSYTSQAAGLEGYRYEMNVPIDDFDPSGAWLSKILLQPHVDSGKKIWNYIEGTYEPIDWQKDYKSGYRWNNKRWYKDVRYGNIMGADVKVPWELARLQHLPQMAIFAMALPERRDQLLREFKNQILDFVATNPPRMGVNWVSTMDVSIRAANMLISFEMFSQLAPAGMIDLEFNKIFVNSIYEHGLFIASNLEWSRHITSNHYLSNIVGLLFIAAFLDRSPLVDCWLGFSIQEIISEYKKQFYTDGGNYESSTSYHRLSGEMIVYATALILGLSAEKKRALQEYDSHLWNSIPKLNDSQCQSYFTEREELLPEWYCHKLFRTLNFTLDITKPNGNIPQIGDNDSGRFFRLSPNGSLLKEHEAKKKYKNLSAVSLTDKSYWDENDLNHATFISAGSALYRTEIFQSAESKYPLEYSIVSSLAKHNFFKDIDQEPKQHSRIYNANDSFISSATMPCVSQEIIKPTRKSKTSLISQLRLICYKDSGIYIYKADRLYLCIYLVPKGQEGFAGHNHNDIGSFELSIDDEDINIDPGTYIYTPLPIKRNLFRSIRYHSVPVVEGREQYIFDNDNVFLMRGNVSVQILRSDETEFSFIISYASIHIVRSFIFKDDCLKITDRCNKPFCSQMNKFQLYSNGYGKRIN
ncbi:MAG: heparinase II/III family protein [Ignavibacteriales bacterium]|nr:heparinase II/III family protein [Ignavibacteriales bacterium]